MALPDSEAQGPTPPGFSFPNRSSWGPWPACWRLPTCPMPSGTQPQPLSQRQVPGQPKHPLKPPALGLVAGIPSPLLALGSNKYAGFPLPHPCREAGRSRAAGKHRSNTCVPDSTAAWEKPDPSAAPVTCHVQLLHSGQVGGAPVAESSPRPRRPALPASQPGIRWLLLLALGISSWVHLPWPSVGRLGGGRATPTAHRSKAALHTPSPFHLQSRGCLLPPRPAHLAKTFVDAGAGYLRSRGAWETPRGVLRFGSAPPASCGLLVPGAGHP